MNEQTTNPTDRPLNRTENHLTFRGSHLTPNGLNLTYFEPNLTLVPFGKTTRRLYNNILSYVQSYVSYVSLAHGVCARAHARVAQTEPPYPENHVRCVRSGFVPTLSCGFHLTLPRKMDVRPGNILRKIEAVFKTGQITGDLE